MRGFLIILTTVFFSLPTHAQQGAEDSVKSVINALFAAMKNGDEAGLKATFSENAIMQTISRDKEGKSKVITESISEFAEFVGKLKKDSADERIRFETIEVDGPLAIAWTPYQFFLNGKFSHCGVNSFQLVRLDNKWMIQYIIDTRRRAGCN